MLVMHDATDAFLEGLGTLVSALALLQSPWHRESWASLPIVHAFERAATSVRTSPSGTAFAVAIGIVPLPVVTPRRQS